MGKPEDIPQTDVDTALDAILSSVGSLPIKNYMPSTQTRAREVMRGILAGQVPRIPHRGTVGERRRA